MHKPMSIIIKINLFFVFAIIAKSHNHAI